MYRLLILLALVPLFMGQMSHRSVKVEGSDGDYNVDVVLDGGVKKMAVLSTTIVEQILGQDPQGTTFFYFGDTLEDADGIGGVNNNVRIEIPAAVGPLNAIYPAVDYTYTITTADVAADNPEREVALNVCAGLRADQDFIDAQWDCQVGRDFAYVHINSRLYNEFGERTTYTLTCSGTTVCNKGEDDIARRGKATELSRSPNDPARLGVLAISGSVTVTPGALSDQFEQHLMDNSNSRDMNVDGDPTQQSFWVKCDPDLDQFITEIRIYCTDNGIKTSLFCAAPAPANGLLVNIVSDGETAIFTDDPIESTGDFLFHVSVPVSNYRLDFNPSLDVLIGARSYANPFPIRKCGTNPGGDDYIQAIVRDDFSSINELEMVARGFKQEP